MNKILEALKPYGYAWLESMTCISGSGSSIVVFATEGDFLTACLTYDYKVVWVMSCGGQEVDANSTEANALHQQSRELFAIQSKIRQDQG